MKVRYVGTARRRLLVFEDGRAETVHRSDPEFGGKGTVLEVDDKIGERMVAGPQWEKDSGGGKTAPPKAAPSGGKE